MAGVFRIRLKPLVLAALLLCASARIHPQSPTGSLSGKLTDLRSAPLAGATVILRNQSTGAQTRVTTAQDGVYRFTSLDPGQYSLEANSDQLGHGQLNDIQISPEHEAHVQAAMLFDRAQPAPVHSVFLQNPRPIALPSIPPSQAPPAETLNLALSNALPTQPAHQLALPSRQILIYNPPPTQSTELTATLQPIPRPARLITVLPTIEVSGAPGPSPLGTGVPANFIAVPPEPTLSLSKGPSPLATGVPAPLIASALPTQPLLLHAPALPNLAATLSIVNGLRAAAQWSVPRTNPIQTAAQRPDPAASTTTTLTANELQSLPVAGRRWEEFLDDTPASAPAADSSQPTLRTAQQATDTTVDGASTQLAFSGPSSSAPGAQGQSASTPGVAEPSGMGQPWASGRGFFVSEAAVRQVDVGAADPQATHASASRINVETERGANNLHGQAFLFDRQNNWGARNPFSQWIKETAPATSTLVPVFTAIPFTPSDHEIAWGIGIGSHIRRNKLFWFAALDSNQRNNPAVAMVKHPYLCSNPPQCTLQTGFFAQPSFDQMQLLGAQLGTNTLSALGKYSQMLETLDGLLGPTPRHSAQWTGFARIDWSAAERHRFTLEGTNAIWNSPGGGLTRTVEAYGTHSLGTTQASRQWLLARWEAFLTPNLLAVTQASAGRSILSAHAGSPSPFEQTLNQNVWGQLPQIVVDSRDGFTIGNPSRFGQGSYPDERLFRVQQSIDWVRGNLLIKAGFDLSHNADSTSLLRNQTGTYHYSSIENFTADALAFAAYGFADALDRSHPHNCDQTGRVWRDSNSNLRGLGYLPCYTYYSQVMGPTNWHLSTNDWSGFATAQWQPAKLAVLSLGFRWEREQFPPPITALANPELPLTGRMPNLGNSWEPRFSLAIGGSETRWPVLRLGYGMYSGRTRNATLENVLTQTGSIKGDLNFFVRPTDNLRAGGAPPFPYVFAGEPLNLVKPGAVQFAPNFRNPQVHQAVLAIEQSLPGKLQLSASAMLSLGRRLPIAVDSNFDPTVNPGTITYAVVDGTGKGPIKASQITVPFYALWPSPTSPTGTAGRLNPSYQQITEVFSRANSTYEAIIVRLNRYGRRGLSLRSHYTYAHAMDWNPDESASVAGNDVLDPIDFSREYGTSNLDIRHSVAATLILTTPWKLHNLAGKLANGWMLSGIAQFRTGMPYTMRTAGSIPKEFNQFTGDVIAGLGPGMNGSAGDNRVYGIGNDKVVYNIGRNTFRYPATWKADLRLSKQFDLGHLRELQLLAESFNLFNHQNVTQIETNGYTISPGTLTGGFPTLTFLTGLKAKTTAFGQPLSINTTNYYRERQFQFGLRMRF